MPSNEAPLTLWASGAVPLCTCLCMHIALSDCCVCISCPWRYRETENPSFGKRGWEEQGGTCDMSSLHPFVTWGSCTNVSQMCILYISHLKNKIKLTTKTCFISQNNGILDTFPHFTDLNYMFKDCTSSLYKIGKIIIKIVHYWMPCSAFCCDKHHDQKQSREGKGLFGFQSIIEESPGRNSKQVPGDRHPSRHQEGPLLPDLLLAHISHLSHTTQANQLRDGAPHSGMDPPTPISNQKMIPPSLGWVYWGYWQGLRSLQKSCFSEKLIPAWCWPCMEAVLLGLPPHLLVTSLKSLLLLQWWLLT